jgi:outer membrane protein assembly factor BamD
MSHYPRSFHALFTLLCVAAPLLGGCGGSSDKDKAAAPTPPVEALYNNGLDALNARRYAAASDQFNSLEQNYPFSPWAVNAQIMQGYSQYLQNKYSDAIATLDHFIQLHPVHRDIAYIYYLRALCYYEQIADIERDQLGTEQAMTALQEVVTRFPNTAFANDAVLKIDLCRDHMAGKEMEITAHVPEALARIVEIYLALGLRDQAKRTAAVLGYNDPGSFWYQNTYDQLAALGDVPSNLPAPSKGGSGFFGRAWHALF